MKHLQTTDSIAAVPFIGTSYQQKLAKLGIKTVQDLLQHYPHKYLDRREATPISQLQPETTATVVAQVTYFNNVITRNRKQLQKAHIFDESGSMEVSWFNQPFLSRVIQAGNTYAFSGKVKVFRNQLSLSSPDFERLDQNDLETSHTVHTGRLIPVYPETAGLSSKWLRSRLDYILKHVIYQETLPPALLEQYHLISLDLAYQEIHQPTSEENLKQARYRLSFDELFYLQLKGALRRHLWRQNRTTNKLAWDDKSITTFITKLPFTLTPAQDKATQEILTDLKRSQPMNRLLEGDVGSGKTVVAAIGLYASFLSGKRGVLMAPTEILAQQHYKELARLFAQSQVSLGMITGSTKSHLDADILVGTHALLFQQDVFAQVGLIVIDEQHRFGVEQRAKLESLTTHPHRLTMSATPIPRTVALTLYGDLDVSIIDELPQNRQPVKTWLVPEAKRQGAYTWIREQVEQGGQVFVVCPLIDQSESLQLKHIRSAAQEYVYLQQVFPQFRIELLHGRMKAAQKEQIIKNFRDGITQMLVSTQVIEVGIDVPKATVIIIEAAQRFGLAQLHQLRGRVGRGDKLGFCLLFSSDDANSSRLQSLTKYHSGFKLAEIDLKLRGPGEVFGLSQHGFDGLKLARLNDKQLLKITKAAALAIIDHDPELKTYPQLGQHLEQMHPVRVTMN